MANQNRSHIFHLFVLLLSLLPSPFSRPLWAEPHEEARVLYEAGVEHYLKGRWPQAVDHLERAMKIAPSKKTQDFLFTVLKDAGLTLSLRKNYNEALLYLEKAKEIYPADAEVLSLYQAAAEMTGKLPPEKASPPPSHSKEAQTPQEKPQKKPPAPLVKRPAPLPPLLSLPSPHSLLPTPSREEGGFSWREALILASALALFSLIIFVLRTAFGRFRKMGRSLDILRRAYERLRQTETKGFAAEANGVHKIEVLVKNESDALKRLEERLDNLDKGMKDTLSKEIEKDIQKSLREATEALQKALKPPPTPPDSLERRNPSADSPPPGLERRKGPFLSPGLMNELRAGRLDTARLLWQHDPANALALFQSMALDPDPKRRISLIYVLADLKTPDASQIIRQLAGDSDSSVRQEAKRALTEQG